MDKKEIYELREKLIGPVVKAQMRRPENLMFVKNREGIYIGASEGFIRLTVCQSEEELIGKTDFQIFADRELAQRYVEDDESLYASGRDDIGYIEPIPGENGTRGSCHTTKYIIYDENHNAVGILGNSINIAHDADLVQMVEKETGVRMNSTYNMELVRETVQIILNGNNTDQIINGVLTVVGEYYNLNRIFIFEDREDSVNYTVSYIWRNQNNPPREHRGTATTSFEKLDGDAIALFDERGIYKVNDVSKMPEKCRQHAGMYGTNSVLHCAFYDGKRFAGYIGFDDVSADRNWTNEITDTLWMISRFLEMLIIREQKTVLAELSEQYLQGLDLQNAYCYIVDPKTYNIVYMNKATRDRFGMEIFGQRCYQVSTGCLEPCKNCPIDNLKKGDMKPEVVQRKDGISMLSGASNIKWQGGSYYLLTCMDITEYQNTVNSQKMDSLLSIANIYFSICRYNFETEVFQVLSLGGKTGDDIYSGNEDIIDWQKNAFSKKTWKEHSAFLDMTTLEERVNELGIVAEDMTTHAGRWIKVLAVPYRHDENGKVTEVLILARDIDAEKQAELKAQEELKAANRAKTNFLSHMSHDIRTPLNAIIGMTEIAKLSITDQRRVADCLAKIKISSDHLLSLINDSLDLTRIESGRVQITNEYYDLKKLTADIMPIVQGYLINRKLTFSSNMGAIENTGIYTDKLHLRQILLNVISNAVKYTPDGGKITFSVDSVALAGGLEAKVTFTVTDTGIGMTPEFLERIYEPFAQEDDNGARTNYKGSGLGMSIVKGYTELLNGKIEIESEQGRGTAVILEFPMQLHSGEVSGAESSFDRGNRSESISVPNNGRKVILAEDNELNREVAVFMLEHAGYATDVALDGEQAVRLFKESEPGYYSFILMDIMMPVMDGYEATEKIRGMERPDSKSIPIFAMTANAFTDDIAKSMGAGMTDHISKPIDMAVIEEKLKSFSQ